jgi:hypothetical protein
MKLLQRSAVPAAYHRVDVTVEERPSMAGAAQFPQAAPDQSPPL